MSYQTYYSETLCVWEHSLLLSSSKNLPRIYQSAKGFTLDNEHGREFISLTQEFILCGSPGLSNGLSAIVRAPFDPTSNLNSVDDP